MLATFPRRVLCRALLAACLFLTIASPGKAQNAVPGLNDELMGNAVRYFAMVTGRDIGAEDSTWLKNRWQEAYATAPFDVFNRVDQLALQFELQERESDPLALASSRSSLIGDAHCSTAYSSAPDAARMKAILAPEGLVLASDCVLGLVVTSFDLDGVVASHRMVAEIVGQSYDEAEDRATLTGAVTGQFADLDLANKQYAAQGELRNAIATKFWALLEGDPRQTETANQLRSQAGQDPSAIAVSARNLETVALGQIGKLDSIAKAGKARLTTDTVGKYLEWLERIAGYTFSNRDRLWVKEALVTDFLRNPASLQQEVAAVEKYNRDYITEKDPARKAAMLAEWAGQLHCYLAQSSNPSEKYLDEILFRHDPVIEADCASNRVKRKRDDVLAEVDGQQLTEGALAPAMRVATLLFGRSLSADEHALIRNDFIQNFKKDPAKLQAEFVNYQQIIQAYEDDNYYGDDYVREDKRRQLFVTIYCSLQHSNEPDVQRSLAMLKEANAVVHEDCSQQLVTTERAINAFIASANFLAFVSGTPPFTQTEEAKIAEALRQEDLSAAEAGLAKLVEWWSLLNLEKKAEKAGWIKSLGVSHPSEAGPLVQTVAAQAQLDLLLIKAQSVACQVNAIVAAGTAGLFVADIQPGTVPGGIDETGVPTGKLFTVLSQAQLGAALCGA